MTWMRLNRETRTRALRGASAALVVFGTAASVAAPRPLAAQQVDRETRTPLTLDDAVAEALTGNPAHRVSGRSASIARAEARAATSPLLPAVDIGTGVTRSDDPVFAFGTRLRQERFSEADFALDALNRPGAITDWTMDAGLRWVPLDPARWAGRSAARSRVTAAQWGETWSAEQTVFATKVLYYQASGADAALRAARAEETAARAAFELFESREQRGLLTRADVLQAEAELRAAEARRLGAERDAERTREDLALHLGWDVDRVPVPTDSLSAPSAPDAQPTESVRADVRSLAAVRDAASDDVRRAGLSFLPRLEGFAGWSSHADQAFGIDGSNWTAGVALRWTVFAGFGRVADRDRASEAREIARIRYEEAVRTARAESVQALRDVAASRAGLAASRAAAHAADEARSLMRRRFDEGLATAAEFLQAEARAAGARSREIAALVDYNVALARLELVADVDDVGKEAP